MPTLRDSFRWAQDLPVEWSRNLDWYLIRLGELGTAPLDSLTDEGTWQSVRAINAHGAQYFLPNIAISITHGALYRLLHRLVTIAAGPGEGPALFDSLMCYCETKTGLINRELFDMAMLARSEPGLAALLASDASSRAVWLEGRLDAFPGMRARLATFLRDHGHREVDLRADLARAAVDRARQRAPHPRDSHASPPAGRSPRLDHGPRERQGQDPSREAGDREILEKAKGATGWRRRVGNQSSHEDRRCASTWRQPG